MRYIRKTGTQFEAEGKKQTKDYIDSCWNNANHKYENLIYESTRLGKLGSVLFDEQKDKNGNSYCCYCMRRLFLKDTEDKHKKNITYEHIVPHKIKSNEWESDKVHYLNFSNLNEKHITVCFEGELTDAQKNVKMTGMPYPHFVSYHNLVASCNGATFEDKTLVNSHCCNNNRKERFVMPIYLSPYLVNGISYTSKGELDYDDSVYDYRWFDKKHLNLTNAWITLVRRIWCKISKSEYTDLDVEQARNDKNLRQNIIDDVDSNNEISSWAESDMAWNLFSEYNWFYNYYKAKP